MTFSEKGAKDTQLSEFNVNKCRVRVGVRVRVRTILEHRSGDRTRVDGVCDFEKVLPDQVFPSAKRG